MRLVTQPQDVITRWVFERTGGQWVPGGSAGLGIADGEVLVAAAAFTDYNGRNVSAHIVIDRPAACLQLFSYLGEYVFRQLGCHRLTLIAEESNLKAVRLHEKLGAVHEGRLVGAGRNGDDILISRLTVDSVIWRKLDGRKRRFREGGSPDDTVRREQQPVCPSGADNAAAADYERAAAAAE